MNLPATMAADAALARQNVVLSSIKHNAEQGKAIANILEESARSAPIHASRGSRVNFSA